MKWIFGITFLLFAVTSGQAEAQWKPQSLAIYPRQESKKRFNKERFELLVQFKEGVSQTEENAEIQKSGASLVRNRRMKSGRRLHRLRFANKEMLQRRLSTLKLNPRVKIAQQNYRYKSMATIPNDPLLSLQWATENTGQTLSNSSIYVNNPRSKNNPGSLGKDLRLPLAWDYVRDCSSVLIAVLDSGIQYHHDDLAANMWNGGASYPKHGWNFVSDTNDPMDDVGHGTHVAGTIGALGNNSSNGVGVCWQAKLMALKVLGADGTGSTDDLAAAIDFAVDRGAKIINMSLGATGAGDVEVLKAAISNAQTNGVLIVAAAGNDGQNVDTEPLYPCSFTNSNILCVAAADQAYELASFSNFGSQSVDVAAPGVNIVSSWFGKTWDTTDSFNNAGTLSWQRSSTTTGPAAGWGYKAVGFSDGNGGVEYWDAMVSPPNWNGFNRKYNSNTDDRVFKTFPVNKPVAALINFYLLYDTESNKDYFRVGVKSGSGDPFAGGGRIVDNFSGTSDGYAELQEYALSECRGVDSCTIGFQLSSDATNQDTGPLVMDFHLMTTEAANDQVEILSGTSMATPHVTGLAALVWVMNPQYDFRQVKEAIIQSARPEPALTGKVVSGGVADAWSAIRYLQKPSGLSFSQ